MERKLGPLQMGPRDRRGTRAAPLGTCPSGTPRLAAWPPGAKAVRPPKVVTLLLFHFGFCYDLVAGPLTGL